MGLKIFIPVTDEILRRADAQVEGNLVPFNPEYLRPRQDREAKGRRPVGWISSNDFAAAKARLLASLATPVSS